MISIFRSKLNYYNQCEHFNAQLWWTNVQIAIRQLVGLYLSSSDGSSVKYFKDKELIEFFHNNSNNVHIFVNQIHRSKLVTDLAIHFKIHEHLHPESFQQYEFTSFYNYTVSTLLVKQFIYKSLYNIRLLEMNKLKNCHKT